MAGTVTVTRSFPTQRGVIAEGTGVGLTLPGGASARAATGPAFSFPGQGNTFGTGQAFFLFVFQNAAGTNGDAADLLWGVVEYGLVAANGVTLWTIGGSTRALTGDQATTVNRGVGGAIAFSGPQQPAQQIITDRFFTTTDPTDTFAAATGAAAPHQIPLCMDSLRVSFFISDAAAVTSVWNVGWKMYLGDY